MPASSENRIDCDHSHGLVDSVVGNIKAALASGEWLSDLKKRLHGSLGASSAHDDCRLWWTIHNNIPNSDAEVRDEMRYLVLALQPGVQEFRGVHVSDGGEGTRSSVDNRTLRMVCRSLCVPKRRGALNWMTDIIAARREAQQEANGILTLYDAWKDLRGHAASEDLILGTRSVAGFPLYLPSTQVQTGYFFISHPLPGLFYREELGELKPNTDFCKAFEAIRQRYADSLALAVDMDMFAAFAAQTRPDPDAERQPDAPEQQQMLIDLSDENPSGCVATVLLSPDSDKASLAINEGAFVREFWSCTSMLSFFPDTWQAATRRMDAYAEKLESGKGALLPIWKLQEHTEVALDRQSAVRSYYPRGADLLSAPEPLTVEVDTGLHRLYRHFGHLYSVVYKAESGYTPQADLVIPLGAKGAASNQQVRIAGFIRINCDGSPKSPDMSDGGPDSAQPYRELYETVQGVHLDRLNQSLGTLILLVDEDLHWLHGEKKLSLFKQTYDAIRHFTNWCVTCMANPQDGGNTGLHEKVLSNVWELLAKSGRNVMQTEHRLQLLRQSIQSVLEFGQEMQEIAGLPVTLVSVWLRLWSPSIYAMEGDRDGFVELILKDPGLLEVLQHMVIVGDSFKRDLFNPEDHEQVIGQDRSHFDFGYPHRDARLKDLQVTTDRDGATLITWKKQNDKTHSIDLRWTLPDDAERRSRIGPVALAKVKRRVSDRIARNIAQMGVVAVKNMTKELRSGVKLTEHVLTAAGNCPRFIEDLEKLFVDADESGGHWTVLPLTRVDGDPRPTRYFCVLQPRCNESQQRPIVAALLDLSLSRALAQFRAEALQREKALFKFRGSVAHGFHGSMGRVSKSIKRMIEALKNGNVEKRIVDGMSELRSQVDTLLSLSEDALYFSDTAFRPVPSQERTVQDLIDDVDTVLLGYQGPYDEPIPAQDDVRLNHPGLVMDYNPRLLRHALARIIENALELQNQLPGQEFLKLEIRRESKTRVVVSVINAVAGNDVEVALQSIQEAMQGRKEDSRGLEEANSCAVKSGLGLEARKKRISKRDLVEIRITIPVVR